MVNDGPSSPLEAIVLERILQDRLNLPSLPAIVIRSLELLRKPEHDTHELVRLLERDSMVSVRVLRLANSAAYTSGTPARTLLAALRRLGSVRTRTLLVESSARQLYVPKHPQIATLLHALFEHALAVALLTRDLMAACGEREASETGYLCGLLHDVGKPVLAAALLERGARGEIGAANLHSWLHLVVSGHRAIGVALADRWELPAELRRTIELGPVFDASAPRSLQNFVSLADAIARAMGIDATVEDQHDAEASVMLGKSLLQIADAITDDLRRVLNERVRDALADAG